MTRCLLLQAVSTLSLELGCVLGFLVLVCTVINYNLYTWANSVSVTQLTLHSSLVLLLRPMRICCSYQILPSSTVSLFHGTNPVFTALLSHYILDTDITAIHLVGGALISLAISHCLGLSFMTLSLLILFS